MKVAIASDNQSFFMKREMNRYLRPTAHHIINLGGLTQADTMIEQSLVEMTEALQNGTATRGILMTTSGENVSLNQPGIRAARCLDAAAAETAVNHDDANLLIIATDKMAKQTMVETILAFLDVNDDKGANHSSTSAFYNESNVDVANLTGENLC